MSSNDPSRVSISDELIIDLVPSRLDALIASIDRKIARQLDEILHAPPFQRLERAWRGLKFVVERLDFRENIKVEVFPCSMEDLRADLGRGIERSGLYAIVYTREYGLLDGRPFGAIIADYAFDLDPESLDVLERLGGIGAAALAPCLANASPRTFGAATCADVEGVDLAARFGSVALAGFAALRAAPAARFLGLTVGRIALRRPFDIDKGPVDSDGVEREPFKYCETVSKLEDTCWGAGSLALATRLAHSFALYRWCPHIAGPESGAIAGLAGVEVGLSNERAAALAAEGFIPLGRIDASDPETAYVHAAPSVERPRTFGESEDAQSAALNHRLGTELPYLFMLCRVAQFMKVVHRQHIGSWSDRVDLERELNEWVGRYVADREGVVGAVRRNKPLRRAHVVVHESADGASWRKLEMQLRPHFRYLGMMLTLRLDARLDVA